ncbi:MAG: hypothetical protein Q9191_000206 [Dirinaria sp. TL-2023a]
MLQPRLRVCCYVNRLPFLYPSFSSRTYASQGNPDHSDPPPPPLEAIALIASQSSEGFKRPDVGAGLRTYKPRTPGLRHLKRPINDHLWKGRPYYPLTFPRKGHHIGGRNHTGKITVRHRGGGHKRRIRMVDFSRMEGGKQTVERIEHDPGRSAHIALLKNNATGKLSYIVAPQGMRAGEVVESFRQGIPRDLVDGVGGTLDIGLLAARTAWRGNCLPLHMIPTGTVVFNVGLDPKKGGQICRSAGTWAMVLNKNEDQPENRKRSLYVDVRLRSGEVRKIHRDACATIGVASNNLHGRAQLGKAGRSRWLGIRPTVRGVAMNANEHPHGGGRGKSKGNTVSQSIWGTLAKGGFKTRSPKKPNRYVAQPRRQGPRPRLERKSRR